MQQPAEHEKRKAISRQKSGGNSRNVHIGSQQKLGILKSNTTELLAEQTHFGEQFQMKLYCTAERTHICVGQVAAAVEFAVKMLSKRTHTGIRSANKSNHATERMHERSYEIYSN